MKPLHDERPAPEAVLFGFMGWLTTRPQKSGPFSMTHDAASAADLVGEYARAQGWDSGDDAIDHSMKRLKPGSMTELGEGFLGLCKGVDAKAERLAAIGREEPGA